MTRAYCFKFLIAAFLIPFGMALVNFIADPYGIWKTSIINGVNNSKNSGFHIRIPKYVGWSHWANPPQTILLGTSRAADGLRTSHHTLKAELTYNMALGGQPIRETLVLFKHALKSGSLRQVVIGLDFFAFNAYWGGDTIDYEKRLIHGSNIDLLFGTGTFTDSLTTIRQSMAAREMAPPAKISDLAIPLAAPQNAMPIRNIFIEGERLFVAYHRPPPYRLYAYSSPYTSGNTLGSFRELLKTAYAHNIEELLAKLFLKRSAMAFNARISASKWLHSPFSRQSFRFTAFSLP